LLSEVLMSTPESPSLLDHLSVVSDPRKRCLHSLSDILTIAILAVICGADTWVDIEEWGNAREDWLRGFLRLRHGIPSHDTFGRVFAQLDPEALTQVFITWTAAVAVTTDQKVIAIDGKTLRRSFDHAAEKAAIHLVSAWSCANRLVLGQLACEEKSNEITAIPRLLALLDLNDCIVTIDAMGCQTAIAETIVERGGDYLLALKENQQNLYLGVQSFFFEAIRDDFEGREVEVFEETEWNRGREESRQVWVCPVVEGYVEADKWKNLSQFVAVRSVRETEEGSSEHWRYYITSRTETGARPVAQAIRSHWQIENSLNWVMDVAFREDDSRVRIGFAAENFSRLRQMALNLLKQEKTAKVGIKIKRNKAGWDLKYLLKVLGIQAH